MSKKAGIDKQMNQLNFVQSFRQQPQAQGQVHRFLQQKAAEVAARETAKPEHRPTHTHGAGENPYSVIP